MASQAEIQTAIDQIITGAQYPANSMRPLLTSMLDFSSAGQTVVFDGLVANDTTMADTTLVLEYGVNIIGTVTPTNFACRLPVPTTGKRVSVVNKSLMALTLFPDYNLGPNGYLIGRIANNPIGVPVSIPPDGNVYDFICIDNPLPGAWVWSAPATAQYDSGEITTNTTAGNNVYSAASGTLVVENSAFASFAVWGSNDGLNNPSLPLVLYNNPGSPNNFIAFKPSSGWSAITKVKVYTNLAYDISNDCAFGFTAGSGYSSYSGGVFVGSTPGSIGVFGNYNVVNPYGGIDQQVPGATLPYGTLATNIGDPGTAWGELVMTTYNPNGSRVGSFYEGLDSNGDDYYFTQMVNFQIQPRQALTGLKFRFFIEYV
jgi:hypothetical protein